MPKWPRRTSLLALSVIAAATAGIFVFRGATRAANAPATFTGSSSCASCHAPQSAAWQPSQHALAMQPATPTTVLARFDGQSGFQRRGADFVASVPSPDGSLRDHIVRYTFGLYPLQQYLVEFPGGRLQVLPLAWDTRPASEGGQRWFDINGPSNPESRVPSPDQHWTAPRQAWNYMCADCHSTGVRKGYVASADSFHTTQSEIGVGCEACHGPGSQHVKWAEYPAALRQLVWKDDGLPNQLTERRGVTWAEDAATHQPRRNVPRATDREIETCAQCHGRRNHIADDYTAGAPLRDYYDLLLMLDDRYFPDGQQRDEVYTYGSFLQSRMYHAGVTCSDCHDPHGGKVKQPGNAVCTQCHTPTRYDTTAHTFHAKSSRGSTCVGCHMPDTAYMQVDARRDHSIRVPRPDLSVALGVPNACTRCHTDRDARWAEAQVLARRSAGPRPPGFQRFAHAFDADDRGAPGAADSLIRVARDTGEGTYARASALARLARYPTSATYAVATAYAKDQSALIRRGVQMLMEGFPATERIEVVAPLLDDPTRAVRQEAAWLLAPMTESLSPRDQRALAIAAEEFIASQRYNGDRAGNRLTLGTFYAQRGAFPAAVAEFQAAARLAPTNPGPLINLAQIYRLQKRDSAALRELEAALRLAPGDPTILRLLRER
jgi:predicted CXXCH cytochrome family protein